MRLEERARGIVREFLKKTGPGIRGLPEAQERESRQGASGRRAEAEHDADGVDCEGGVKAGVRQTLWRSL